MKVVFHHWELALMMGPSGSIGQATMRASGRVRDRAKENATVDTGLMRNSIISEIRPTGLYAITYRVGTHVFYGIYQELGTPPIFARRAPLLIFKVGGRWISTYSTKGVPAAKFLTRAIDDTTARDFR